MDTSPRPRAPRRNRRPADAASPVDDRPVPAPRARMRTRPAGRSANDALWWVVLHQGAVDYAQSVGAADRDAVAATRLVDSLRTGVVARADTHRAGPVSSEHPR